MTDIGLYGGPLKRAIILRAYGLLGQAPTEFELSPEEFDTGLQCMNDIAATYPGIGYNFPDPLSPGNPDDESGIAAADALGFTAAVAQELGPNIGKAFSPNRAHATAMSSLRAKYTVVPMRELGRQTIRGAGNRRYACGRPFFIATPSDDEVIQ